MKILRSKSKVYTVALVLLLIVTATLAALPIVSAHDPPWTIPTYAFVSVSHETIGVGQQVIILYWPNQIPPTSVGAYGDRWTWTVEITKPDGDKDIFGSRESDPIGGGYLLYTPDQEGSYSVVAIMDDHEITGLPVPPGGYFMGAGVYINDTFLGGTSDTVYFTAQEEQIEGWSETPLPTEYWERPINSMNRGWWQVAGNWLSGVAQNVGPTSRFGYGTGPESAHIMWATPMWAGGIMDARFGVTGYSTSDYEGIGLVPPIILNGKLYYNVQSLPRYGWYCLDLYTGEVEYFHNTTGPITGVTAESSGSIVGEALSFGQIYDYDSPNQHGGKPYLWSLPPVAMFGPSDPNVQTNWMMFDAYTGNYMCSIKNVPSWVGLGEWAAWMGARSMDVYGKDGSIISYNIVGTPNPAGPFFPDVPPFYLQCWNTSRAIWYKPVWYSNEYWLWRPGLNETYDGNNGYSLNVSIPAVQGPIRAVREDEFVIGGTEGSNDDAGIVPGNLWALSLEPGEEGTLLWNITFTPPYDEVAAIVSGLFETGGVAMGPVDPEDGVFLFSSPITRERWGYDLETGEYLWGPTEPEPAMSYYGMQQVIYQGKLFGYGYGGKLIAYNITTGKELWTYTAENVGYESPYGNYPLFMDVVADGKLYMYSSEHSPTQPLWRGSYLRCIDAETGDELWKISHWEGAQAPALGCAGPGVGCAGIADGYLVTLNLYDNQIYCYGKGPSATTVSTSPKIIANGSSVLIEGTVTDQSPGAEGTPAISDASMTKWMEYLYMQQQCPMDATGVPVKLEAFGEDGSYIEIGTVTSDSYGNFKHAWTPPDEGLYTVMATFEGSKSYWPSYAGTGLSVGAAPPEPTEPAVQEDIDQAVDSLTPLFYGLIVAVVVAIVIGIVNLWALRKRS